MSAEKILRKFFSKLTKKDFAKDVFLKAFYKFFKKVKSEDLFECYIDYITRTQDFADSSERQDALDSLYADIANAIIYKDLNADTSIGFVTDKERNESKNRHEHVEPPVKSSKSKTKTKSEPTNSAPKPTLTTSLSVSEHVETSINPVKFVRPEGVIKLNKAKTLEVLSGFIQKSSIITYKDPGEVSTEQDQVFRDNAADNIVLEICGDGRVLPPAEKDIEFGKRVDMMNIWRDTEEKCQKLCEDPTADMIISKLFFINTAQLLNHPDKIETITMKEINDILPVETFIACHTRKKYQTVIKLTNTLPITEVISRAEKKIKTLYICAGSQMVQGGNADQGLNVSESLLYLTSTYSVGIAKALHAYPLTLDQVILCPNVLVFKDANYKPLPVSKYQRIAVMCAPNKWRPAITGKSPEDIYDAKTGFSDKELQATLIKSIAGFLETALFFGYDTVVLDDRAIEDNGAPAHATAKMLRDVLGTFNGRFNEVTIAVSKAASFNVFRHYFSG